MHSRNLLSAASKTVQHIQKRGRSVQNWKRPSMDEYGVPVEGYANYHYIPDVWKWIKYLKRYHYKCTYLSFAFIDGESLMLEDKRKVTGYWVLVSHTFLLRWHIAGIPIKPSFTPYQGILLKFQVKRNSSNRIFCFKYL